MLANTALLEMTVGEAEVKARLVESWSQSASLDDTPESIAHSPLIKPDTIQEAIEKLEGVLTRGTEEHQEVCPFDPFEAKNTMHHVRLDI